MPSHDYRWTELAGDGPLVATAIHAGHAVRSELRDRFALKEAARLREEDPFTARWTTIAPVRIVVPSSRFEVDPNRARELAVYQRPEDSWNLQVWKEPLPEEVVNRSLAVYDDFYAEVRAVFSDLLSRHTSVVVLDLHTYNHRRNGPDAPPAAVEDNPEINVGTGNVDRERWGDLVERFMQDLRDFDYQGRSLDVRENVRFRGGYFSEWLHDTFGARVCPLAVEVKKFFMDEHTGEGFPDQIEKVREALASTVPGLLEEVRRS